MAGLFTMAGDVLGTNSQIGVDTQNAFQKLQPWQQTAANLSSQLATQAEGGGPNPAQEKLLQNTGQITKQQTATYSANRSLNPALAARMAGNTAVATGEKAASDASIQQAEQQLSSQQLLGNVTAQQEGALNQASAINAQVAAGNQQQAGKMAGGLMSGAAAAIGLAHGGRVLSGPKSYVTHYFNGGGINLKSGGHVPGRARVRGDSKNNDTVPAMLSPGEVVLPRTKANSPDKAAKFVAAVLAKNKGLRKQK